MRPLDWVVPFHILFLHGRFSTQSSWTALIEQLAHRYTSITLDLPGFGDSPLFTDTPFVRSEHLALFRGVLEHYEAWGLPLVLVGHDLGCAWVEWMLEEYPAQVHGVVYLNSFSRERPVSLLKGGWRAWQTRRLIHRLCQRSPALSADAREKIQQTWNVTAQRRSQEKSLQTLACEWEGVEREEELEEQRMNSPTPALILWGKKDELNPMELGLKLFSQLPSSSFFENENCSHWPHLEDPAWVYGHMSSFLFELENEISADRKFLSR